MNYNFFIVGGDKRMFYLAKKLSDDGNKVKVLGFEKIGYDVLLNNNIKIAHSINEIEKKDIIVGGIPISTDGINFYTPYSSKKIKLNELKDRKIIAGKIPEYINGFDFFDDESLKILNGIPTTEGAIAKIIEETDITIKDSNILVIGYGRIGKLLTNKLKNLCANVYCTARKEEDLAWIKAYGYEGIKYDELDKKICKMDIIINTVPSMILDKKRLILLKNNVLILDLASKPGGVDKESAKRLNIKNLQYLGIPGKIAPEKTSGYIMNSLYKIVEKNIV